LSVPVSAITGICGIRTGALWVLVKPFCILGSWCGVDRKCFLCRNRIAEYATVTVIIHLSLTMTRTSLISKFNKILENSNSGNKTQHTFDSIEAITEFYTQTNCPTLVPVVPSLLSLRGKPMTLDRHFVMEPLYRRVGVPPKCLLKCARQVSKSTTLGAQGVLRAATMPYINQIYVAPLFEQIRRFSNNVVKPMIDDSPIHHQLMGYGADRNQDSVFQRTFLNGANMFFTFAFLDAERARGIAGDILSVDEVQDIDIDHLPVLESCLDASDLGIEQFSGTPKTTDNAIHVLWENSSQAHWVTKCTSCSHYNIASLETGIMDMLQPEGFCCQKCMALLNPFAGFWYHFYKDRADTFPSYHVPQPVLPMHYANPTKWFKLMDKKAKWPVYRFLNEVLGESCDSGSRLVTRTQLMKCSTLPWQLRLEDAVRGALAKGYTHFTLGVDWGGGGGGTLKRKRNQIVVEGGTASFTVASVAGFKYSGSLEPDIVYAERLPVDITPFDEIRHLLKIFHLFGCKIFAHDFGGAGSLRESMLIQAGLPSAVIMPCLYCGNTSRTIVTYNAENVETNQRRYYSVDKARSLALLCAVINADMVQFPQWPDATASGSHVVEDFLSLMEDKVDRPGGADIYRITRNPKQSDDFCHATNFACLAHWHSNASYPDLAERFNITSQDLRGVVG